MISYVIFEFFKDLFFLFLLSSDIILYFINSRVELVVLNVIRVNLTLESIDNFQRQSSSHEFSDLCINVNIFKILSFNDLPSSIPLHLNSSIDFVLINGNLVLFEKGDEFYVDGSELMSQFFDMFLQKRFHSEISLRILE